MKDIKIRLQKCYNEVQINKLLYDNQPFYKRLDIWILILILISAGLVAILTFGLPFTNLYLILYIIAVGFGGFLIINKGAKKRLIRKKIKVKKGLLEHWNSEYYQEKKLKFFYDLLIENNLLNKTKTDLKLLIEYENYCKEESNFFKTNQHYLWGGGILVLFILPVWSEIVRLLLGESKNIIETLRLIVSFLAMIGLSIYLLTSIDKALIQFTNSTSRKYSSIQRQLKMLRMNLLIKYAKKMKRIK